MLAECEYDYEKLEKAAKDHNKKVAELERKRNGGKSKHAPGQRRKIKAEQAQAKAIREVEEGMKREAEEARKQQIAEAALKLQQSVGTGSPLEMLHQAVGKGAAVGGLLEKPADLRSKSLALVETMDPTAHS